MSENKVIPPRLEPHTIHELLVKNKLSWMYDPENEMLFKKFEFKGFYKTMNFANMVAYIANKHNHHPDMHINFSSCTVFYQTHDAGGITELDFKVIKEIELTNQ